MLFKHLRKYHTKLVIEKTCELLSLLLTPFGFSKKMIGFFVFLFHWGITAIAFFGLISEPCNSTFFHMSVGLWVAIFIHHFYFHGCIFTKIERHLWDNKQWKGPWSLLPFSTNHLSYISWGILLVLFVSIKCASLWV